jgi:tetratricopeptide (TPR) repeat protein
MAPEQASGQTALVGEATDVHALGAILCEMLSGRPPYGGGSPVDVLIRVMKDEPLPPRRIDRRIPRDLETICLKCLAKAPERRYPTVRALLEDVLRFETGRPILARRPGWIARGLRFVRRRWKMAAALAITATAAALVAALLVGPRADELIAAGDERHEAGRHAEALRLYRRALRWAGDFPRSVVLEGIPQGGGTAGRRTFQDDYPRSIILERIIRCCHEEGDEDGAVEAALQMLDYDPDAWFGEYNHAVAEAVRARPRTIRAKSFFGITRDIPPDELALKRLQIFLNGPHGSDAERARAEQALAELRLRLGNVPPGFSGVPQRPLTFPTGKPADLLRQADDGQASPLQRAAAAMGAGKALEQAGDTVAARQAYRKAYEVLRARFPVYAGVTQGLEMSHPRSLRLEALECSALRFVVYSLRRLDATMKDPLRGGLRFRITGLDLPPDLVVQLSLTLWDPKSADAGAVRATLGNVVVQLDQTAWVGVADGRYRLAAQGTSRGSRSSASYGARANRLYGRMELDFSALNAKQVVEVRGNTVDLPPIRAWLRE